MVTSWKIIVATLVIYTAGLITGTFLNDLRSNDRPQVRKDPMPRGPRMHDFIQRFGTRLDLTDTQKTNITQILKSSQERMNVLMKEMHPKIDAEFTQVNSEIKGHLTEKQAAQFDEIMKNRRNQGPGGPRRGFGNGPGRGEGRNRGPGVGEGLRHNKHETWEARAGQWKEPRGKSKRTLIGKLLGKPRHLPKTSGEVYSGYLNISPPGMDAW
jgi:hypothetical protein